MARYRGTSEYGKIMPLEERFRLMVDIKEDTDSCWLWKGKQKPTRKYPAFKINGKGILVHRWAYEHYVGPVPEGMLVDHLCNNNNCSNPWHLEPKTSRENTMRGDTPARRNAEKTHCIRGHLFDEANTIYSKSYTNDRKYRQCKICDRAAHVEIKRRYRERQKAKQLQFAA